MMGGDHEPFAEFGEAVGHSGELVREKTAALAHPRSPGGHGVLGTQLAGRRGASNRRKPVVGDGGFLLVLVIDFAANCVGGLPYCLLSLRNRRVVPNL